MACKGRPQMKTRRGSLRDCFDNTIGAMTPRKRIREHAEASSPHATGPVALHAGAQEASKSNYQTQAARPEACLVLKGIWYVVQGVG